MPTLGEVISKIAAKIGVDTSTPDFLQVVVQSANIEAPSSVVEAFDRAQVLTPDSAKNDPELKRMFMAQALNGLDADFSNLIEVYQLPEEFKTEYATIQRTKDKFPAIAKAIQALEAKKLGATAGEKSNLQQQINALQAEKAGEIKRIQEEADAKVSAMAERMRTGEIRSKIKSKKLDTSKFDAEIMTDLAYNMLNKHLAEKGAKIVSINDTFVLKNASDETLDYYENNVSPTLEAVIDQVLANNKLLAVNEPTPAPVNIPGPRQYQQTLPPSGQPTGSFFTKLEQTRANMAAQ